MGGWIVGRWQAETTPPRSSGNACYSIRDGTKKSELKAKTPAYASAGGYLSPEGGWLKKENPRPLRGGDF